jgi:hypothetical protein
MTPRPGQDRNPKPRLRASPRPRLRARPRQGGPSEGLLSPEAASLAGTGHAGTQPVKPFRWTARISALPQATSRPASAVEVSGASRNRCCPGKCSSNTQPHETRWPALQQTGIDGLFSAAVLSYPLGVRKPSPAFYRIVLAAADCPAGQVLFVGDHLENDAAAPARHGMRAALVRPRGLRPGEVLPDGALLITHVSELPPLLQTA